MPAPEEKEARYRQVLAWWMEGLPFPEIGRGLGIGTGRAQVLHRAAQQWQRTGASNNGEPLTADMPLAVLPLDVRSRTILLRRGVRTLGAVAALSDAELLCIRRIGRDTLRRLRADLAARYRPTGSPNTRPRDSHPRLDPPLAEGIDTMHNTMPKCTGEP